MKNIVLGNKVRDVVSGLVGIAVSRLEQLDGSSQFGIQPEAGKDAQLPPVAFVPTGQCLKVDDGVHVEPLVRPIGFRSDTGAAARFGQERLR